tara:strand:+ start:3182 stop:3643 length:462 start_codon:yes stop_codon:yes gene_type:complete
MSWVVTAIAITATSAVYGAMGAKASGKAQQQQLELEAKRREEQAIADAAQLEAELNDAAAARRVAQAMSGASAEGSMQSINLGNAKTRSAMRLNLDATGLADAASLRLRGANAKATGDINAVGSILGGAANIAMLGAPKPGAPKTKAAPPKVT